MTPEQDIHYMSMAVEQARLAAELGEVPIGAVVVYEHALARQQEVADALCALEGFELTGLKKYGKVGVAYLELGEGADA